jgi:hypothetical protein
MVMEHRQSNAMIFNTTAAKLALLAIEVDIATWVGFDGIEITAVKQHRMRLCCPILSPGRG